MLQITDLTLRIAGRPLLERASVTIADDAKVGLVGRNGSGKTTLFRAICSELAPDHGSISLPKGWRIGRIAQEAPGGPQSLLEEVLAADAERTALLREAETQTDAHTPVIGSVTSQTDQAIHVDAKRRIEHFPELHLGVRGNAFRLHVGRPRRRAFELHAPLAGTTQSHAGQRLGRHHHD